MNFRLTQLKERVSTRELDGDLRSVSRKFNKTV